MVRFARQYAWRVVFAVILTTSPATAASLTDGNTTGSNAVSGALEAASTSTT